MKKNDILTYAISASLLIVSLSIAYYLVIYIPKLNAMKLQKEEAQAVQVKQKEEAVQIEKKTEPQIREDCETEGQDKAKEKLQKLIDAGLVTGSKKTEYENAMAQGLALKEDIEYYRKLCLENNGL